MDGIAHSCHIGKLYGRTVVLDEKRPVINGVHQLIVGLDHPGSVLVGEAALGLIRRLARNGGSNVLKTQPEMLDHGRVYIDADSRG